MPRPRTPNERRRDEQRNARLANWIAREKASYLAAVAWRAGAPKWLSEDVVQSGLTSFVRAFPGPDIREAALAYCAKCVASEASKACRRYGRKESREAPMRTSERNDLVGTIEEIAMVDDDAADPADMVVERERLAALRELLGELPADQRAVVFLSAAGYAPREIAELRGLTERQVRKRIEKANRRLRGG
jgi:RNA polymerase sigma factor (sigma-70 family)